MVLKVKINLTKLKATGKCEDHQNSNLKSPLQTNNQKN